MRALLVAFMLIGCAEVGADNPFDPQAPKSKQQKGQVRGTLVLPSDFSRALFDGAAVELYSPRSPTEAAYGAAIEVAETTEDEAPRATFLAEEVAAGSYRVRVAVRGFTAPDLQVALDIGASVDLGDVVLGFDQDAAIEGQTLLGDRESGHDGILVEAVNTSFSTQTNSQGRFVLPVSSGVYTLRFSLAHYEPATLDDVDVAGGSTRVLPEPVVLQGQPARVRGSVAFEDALNDSQLVESASVEVVRTDDGEVVGRAAPDPDGAFFFEAIPAGTYRVEVTLAGFFAPAVRAEPSVGAEVDLGTLVLFRDREVSAFVDGTARLQGLGDGRHAGIRVEALNTPFGVNTNSDGGFRIELPPGRHTLRFGHVGYAGTQLDVGPLAPRETTTLEEAVVLVGDPGGVVGVVALDPGAADPAVLREVQVSAVPADAPEAEPHVAELTHAGDHTRFVLRDLPAGRYAVRFGLGGFYPELRVGEVPVGGFADVGHVVLRTLPADALITGVAQIEGGQDHADIAIELEGTALRTQTNSDGLFALRVPAGRLEYLVRARKAGFSAPEPVRVGAFDPRVPFEIEEPILLQGQPGVLEGIVQLDERFDDALLEDVDVRLKVIRDGEAVLVAQREPGADGVFIFEDLTAGSYVLEVTLEGFFPGFRAPVIGPGERVSAGIIRLSPAAAQAVFVGHARIQCPDDECDHGGIQVETVGAPFVTLTNASGEYLLDVVQGEYSLRYTRAGYGAETGGPHGIDAGERKDDLDDIVLVGAPGRVLGRLTLPEGFDEADLLPRTAVRLYRPDDDPDEVDPRGAAVVQADGLFLVDGVTEGDWVVRIALAGFAPEALPLQMAPGAVVDLGVVPLAVRRPVRVQGTVRLEGSDDHDGVHIAVAGTPFFSVTGPDGGFDVQALPGPQTLVLSRAGYDAPTLELEALAESEHRNVGQIDVPFLRAHASGVVLRTTDDGATVPALGATVTLSRLGAPPRNVPTNAEGAFTVGEVREGEYTLGVDLARHGSISRPVRLLAGQTVDAGVLVVDVDRGSITGTALRGGVPGGGGVTLVATRVEDGLGLGPVLRVARADAPTDRYAFERLPVGTWRVSALADGHRPDGPDEVVVAAGRATPHDVVLAARVHRLAAEDAVVRVDRVALTFTADDDLRWVRAWVGDAPGDWAPLPEDGRVTLVDALRDAGSHLVRGQLATDALVEAGEPLLRATSPVLEVEVTYDPSAPLVAPPVVGDGSGFVASPDGDVQVRVDCVDGAARQADLRLRVEVDGAVRFDDLYRPVVALSLGDEAGRKTVRARCTDPAGNVAEWVGVEVVHDFTPPEIERFAVTVEVSNERDVPVAVEVTDALAGLAGVALGEGGIDCENAAYGPAPARFLLAPTNGQKRLFLCARDLAGNTTAPTPAESIVRLDTVAPAAPTGTLGDGGGWSRGARVALDLSTTDDDTTGYRVILSGDLQAPVGPFDWDAAPANVDLRAGRGLRVLRARVVDDAGNASPEAAMEVRVDDTPPTVRFTRVGDGSGYVRDAQGSTFVEVACDDDVSAALTLTVAEGPQTLFEGPLRAVVGIELGDAERAHRLTVRCTNPVGLTGEGDPLDVMVDHTAPSIEGFTLNGGVAGAPTNERTLAVATDVTDALSGVLGVALGEAALDCANAAYLYPGQGQVPFVISAANGARRLHLCAKDRAGNVTASVQSANAIELDTVPPGAPGVVLAAWSQDRDVEVAISTSDDDPAGYRVRLFGDTGDLTRPWGQRPDSMTVTRAGPNTVHFEVSDAAGNVSERTSRTVVVDVSPPTIGAVTVGDGGGFARSRNVDVEVSCDDALGGGQLDLRVTVDGVARYDGAYAPRVAVDLQAGDGARDVVARCTDPSGRSAESASARVVLDTQAPTIDAFTLNGGGADEPTNVRTLTVSLDVDDARSGIAGVALGEAALDCANAAYLYPGQGQVPFVISAANGSRRLHLCAKDGAGNVTASIQSDNAVELDTVAPSAPGVVTAAWSQDRELDVTITTDDDDPSGYRLRVFGDTVDVTRAWGQRPDTVTVTRGGSNTVHFEVSDAAGNVSERTSRAVVVDEAPPTVGPVTVGDGGGFAKTRNVDVEVSCDDALGGGQLDLRITVDGVTRYNGDYAPRVAVDLQAGDGPRDVVARCTDPSGRAAASAPTRVVLDTQAPTVDTFTLNGGGADEPTNERALTVTLDVDDARSGVTGVALGEAALDCAGAAYLYPPSGQVQFTVSAGNGAKRLHLCARDGAGNASASVQSTNAVRLDTVAPSAPTVDVDAFVQAVGIGADISTVDADPSAYTLRITGDVVPADRTYAWAARPDALTLDHAGTNEVHFVVTDGAGNASDGVSHTVVVDAAAPTVGAVTVGDGGGYATARNVDVDVDCHDAVAGANLTLRITVDGVARFDGPYASRVNVDLQAGDGPRTVVARCTDPSGRAGVSPGIPVTLDTTQPAIAAFTLNGGANNEPTNKLNITAHVNAADATAGIEALALFEDGAIDCDSALYAYGDVDDIGFALANGEGARRLYLCARDGAGNVSARAQSNALLVDTVAPEAGTLTLAGGATLTNTRDVPLAVATNEGGLTATLAGDLTGKVQFAVDTPPATVRVSAGDGDKVVALVLADAAGNSSSSTNAVVRLDTAPPPGGTVVLNGGQVITFDRNVPITIEDTNPDTMQFWEIGGGRCDVRACSHGGFVPFAPQSSFTVSDGGGFKSLCWRFCDAAGNASPTGGGQVRLVPARPRPTLTSLDPDRHVAFSQDLAVPYEIDVHGDGIAPDTEIVLGDFRVGCHGATFRRGGAPIVPTNCSVAAPNNCADQCTIRLPALLMQNAGDYLTRLETPDPVANAQNASAEELFFHVIAPLPEISRLSPHGEVQLTDADGNPAPRNITVTVAGRFFTDNATFRVGPNSGTVVRRGPDPANPGDDFAEEVVLSVSTEGLQTIEGVHDEFGVSNPSPGGGEVTRPFGINPDRILCENLGACIGDLRYTRRDLPLPRLHGARQRYGMPPETLTGAVAWRGGTAAAVYGQDGALATRIRAEWSGGSLPWGPNGTAEVVLADTRDAGHATQLRDDRMFFAERRRGVGTFVQRQSMPLGGGEPVAMALGDLDRDGDLEVAVAVFGGDSVMVYEGTSNGQFDGNARTRWATGVGPRNIELADVNGDGLLDMVTANAGDDSVSLRFGHGDGSFDARRDLSMGTGPLAVHVADADGDGLPDIITADCGFEQTGTGAEQCALGRSDTVTLRYGDGVGGFSAPVAYTMGPAPSDVLVTDLDGDAIADLVAVTTTTRQIVWRRGLGHGAFEDSAILVGDLSNFPMEMVAADLDANGTTDIAVAMMQGRTVAVFVGDGQGGLTANGGVGLGLGEPGGIAVGDVNGDGWPDVVSANHGTTSAPLGLDSFSVMTGDGDATFTKLVPDVGTGTHGPLDIALADLNEDGALDVVTLHRETPRVNNALQTPRVMVFHGNPGAQLGNLRSFPAGGRTRRVKMLDLNGDGDLDVASIGDVDDEIRYWLGDGSGGLGGQQIGAATHDPVDLAVGDLSNDGEDDLVTVSTDGSLNVWLGLANGMVFGAFSVPNIGSSPQGLAIADKDGDGKDDVFVASGNDDTVRIIPSDPVSSLPDRDRMRSYSMGDRPVAVALADLDSNGRIDVVTADEGGHTVSLRQGNPGTSLRGRTSYVMAGLPNAVALGDLDGDGTIDVVTGHYVPFQHLAHPIFDGDDPPIGLSMRRGTVAGRFRTGNGNTSLHDLGVRETVRGVRVADFNGDGQDDLLISVGAEDSVRVLIGPITSRTAELGARQWRAAASFEAPIGRNILGVDAGDLNGDGAPDLVTANNDGDSVSRWMLPAPGAWLEELSIASEGPVAVDGTVQVPIPNVPRYVEQAAVRVRIVASAAITASARLIAPDGTEVLLFQNLALADGAVHQAHYPPQALPVGEDLDDVIGWQPAGEWRIRVDTSGPAQLQAGEVILRSWFTRP